MEKFMNWMTEEFAPKMNKISRNPWISGVQEAILTIMPVILIGSISTILNIVSDFVPSFPDFSAFSDFSFGLMSLFLAFLIPMTILDLKKHKRVSRQAGLAGVSLFLLILMPEFDDAGNMIVNFINLGSGGMIAALISGIFVAAVMNLFAKFSFFDEDTAIPDFITVWFDTLIPITIIIFIGWVSGYIYQISIFDIIYKIFEPFMSIGQSFWGFVIFNFISYSFLYSFGISTWLLYPIDSALSNQGMGANIALAQAGKAPTNIYNGLTTTFFTDGGGGMTLALNVMMLFAASKRLRAIGKSTIVPSIANINEPLVFGAPIAFNPILMIPMWIIGLIAPAITYLAFSSGFIPITTEPFGFWYVPTILKALFITKSFRAVILVIGLFILSFVIYYPFFKIYDNQILAEEEAEFAAENNLK